MKRTHIKGLFIFSALIGAIVLFVFTQVLIKDIRAKQKRELDLWVKSIKLIVESENPEQISFVFNEIVTVIDFPAILTDAKNNPTNWRNIKIDSSLSNEVIRKILDEKIVEMDSKYQPLAVKIDSTVLQYVHYGDSRVVTMLQLAPFVTSIAGVLFIMIVYFTFSSIRRSDQSNLWVGMSKETAHQLGTPLSSLNGWIELLKFAADDPEKQAKLIFEMQTDVARLNRVATRFSKIGSKVSVKDENINEVMASVFNYYQNRIPQMGKSITLSQKESVDIIVPINRELMEWVLENITKNGIDAIEKKVGEISAEISQDEDYAYIDISDNGKGIEPQYRGDIFRAGFTTKSRGWGLGLSLAKRIVEDYHNGKLLLKESKIGEGSTFRIKLKKTKNILAS